MPRGLEPTLVNALHSYAARQLAQPREQPALYAKANFPGEPSLISLLGSLGIADAIPDTLVAMRKPHPESSGVSETNL